MPVIIIPDTGVNNIYVNQNTGFNIILSGISEQNSINITGSLGPIVPHNYLNGIQGGQSNQYYHLTSDEYANLVTGSVIRPEDTGIFYTIDNPSGFITGVDLSDYAQTGYLVQISGNLQDAIDLLDGQTGNYYLNSNPSGYITGVDLSAYVTGDVIRPSDTGQFYPVSNPSGYITGISNIVYTTGNQRISGQKEFLNNSLFDQNIRVSGVVTGESVYVDRVSFDLSPTGIIQEGELQWNSTDGTLDLGMNGGDITMQLGQEMFTKVRNQSGATITNGSAVYFAGRAGNRPLIGLARADSDATSRVAGIATQDITSPSDGFITTVGYIRGVKTNYTGTGIWGTTWAEGDLLYVSKTVAGQVTNIEPSAPHHSDIIGTVGIVHNSLGSILVTPDRHMSMEELSDVNGTALTTDGQIPIWHQVSGFFDFDKNINDYYLKTNPSGYITGVDLSSYATQSFATGISGYLQGQITELDSQTGQYYLNSNPSGYITGVDLSSYSTISDVTGVSGHLQDQITSLDNSTENYYLNSNPSGYITGIDQISFSVLLHTGIEETGILFPRSFSSQPRVFADLLSVSDTGYLVGIKSVTVSGYTAMFSDVIEETGIYLQTLATNL